MRVLAVNAGSSSLKLSVTDATTTTVAHVELGPPREAETRRGLGEFLARIGVVDAVGHRLVHGGPDLQRSVRVDDEVRSTLTSVVDLAPLHLPPALEILDHLREGLHVPHVACFDTAFHRTLPEAARTYALPAAWRQFGVRRYGFHGLSDAWATRRAGQILGRDSRDLGLVIAHLGAGASICAVRGGRSIDTTMGFTPNEGVVMATRSGSVDPGALLWLQTARGVDAATMSAALETESGWRALSGIADMRALLERSDDESSLAVDVVVRSVRSAIAAMASALPSLDALVFTGGIGAHSTEMQSRLCSELRVVGIGPLREPDRHIHRNQDGDADAVLTALDAGVAVLAVLAREDLEIAREVDGLLS